MLETGVGWPSIHILIRPHKAIIDYFFLYPADSGPPDRD